MCACVCVWVRACVRLCMHACVRVCLHPYVCKSLCVSVCKYRVQSDKPKHIFDVTSSIVPLCSTSNIWSSCFLQTLGLTLVPLWKYTRSHSCLPSFSTQYVYVNFRSLGRSPTFNWPLYRCPHFPLCLNHNHDLIFNNKKNNKTDHD